MNWSLSASHAHLDDAYCLVMYRDNIADMDMPTVNPFAKIVECCGKEGYNDNGGAGRSGRIAIISFDTFG